VLLATNFVVRNVWMIKCVMSVGGSNTLYINTMAELVTPPIENSGIRRTQKSADAAFGINLQMPVLSGIDPGRRPGDFGLFGSQVCIRKQDQSVLCLEAAPQPDTWADVVARGNDSGSSVTVTGSLTMITNQSNINPVNVLTVNKVTGVGAPSGSTAPEGSLVFNDDDTSLYFQNGAGWTKIDSGGAGDWNAVLNNGAASGNVDPIISTDREITYQTGIRIGGAGSSVVGTGIGSIAIGATANASGDTSIAFGSGAISSGSVSVSVGSAASATQTNSLALGSGSNSNHTSSVALGIGSITTEANQIRLGSASQYVSAPAYLESGLTSGARLTTPSTSISSGAEANVAWNTLVFDNFRSGTSSYIIAGVPTFFMRLQPNAYYAVSAYINGTYNNPVIVTSVLNIALIYESAGPVAFAGKSITVGATTSSISVSISGMIQTGNTATRLLYVRAGVGISTGATLNISSGFFTALRIS
jgi:hypothetical protein